MSELFPDYRSPWENDDQQVLRKHAAEFFHKECTPHQERWAAQHQVDRDFWNKAGAAGLLCLDLPEDSVVAEATSAMRPSSSRS